MTSYNKPSKLLLFAFSLLSMLIGSLAVQASEPSVLLGIDVLEKRSFADIAGKRVGLLTNPAGVNSRGISTIQVLHRAPQVELVALFGPEHGIRGDERANVPVPNQVDSATGLPVYSLYGPTRKPTPAMLKGLDAMVIDLQDIGSRSYTYASCMKLTMEACFELGIQVVVLDRPNPLGGIKMDGPLMDPEWHSYVGAFPLPYVHGLTIGELAKLATETSGWLDLDRTVLQRARLLVIPMAGWHPAMTWDQTGLQWVATSPGIPSISAALGYAMLGLGAELNGFSHGFGTEYPFRLLSHRGVDSETLLHELEKLGVEGLAFQRVTATNARGNPIDGVYVQVTDWDALSPTEISFHMMRLSCRLSGSNPYSEAPEGRSSLFNKHVGSTAWWTEISTHGANADVERFLERWREDAEAFRRWVTPRRIYRVSRW